MLPLIVIVRIIVSGWVSITVNRSGVCWRIVIRSVIIWRVINRLIGGSGVSRVSVLRIVSPDILISFVIEVIHPARWTTTRAKRQFRESVTVGGQQGAN